MNKEFIVKLAKIQQGIKAPKSQTNTFGKYKYRNCEDILEAVKPLLGDLLLTISDDIKEVSGRFYIVATASITDGENTHSATAMARESLTEKGKAESQATGSASSYARKYALNGLFCIDDTKDADHGSPVNSDIDLIVEAANKSDMEFIKKEWQGMIAKNWGQLGVATTNKLNAITSKG